MMTNARAMLVAVLALGLATTPAQGDSGKGRHNGHDKHHDHRDAHEAV